MEGRSPRHGGSTIMGVWIIGSMPREVFIPFPAISLLQPRSHRTRLDNLPMGI